MNKEQLAEEWYEEGKFKSDFPRCRQSFIEGYKKGKPKWTSTENKPPEYNKHVLLKYIKGKEGEVITQGYFQDEALEIARRNKKSADERGVYSSNGVETIEFWRRCGYGDTYFDYAGRQIQKLEAKSKNKVIAWMEIPA